MTYAHLITLIQLSARGILYVTTYVVSTNTLNYFKSRFDK